MSRSIRSVLVFKWIVDTILCAVGVETSSERNFWHTFFLSSRLSSVCRHCSSDILWYCRRSLFKFKLSIAVCNSVCCAEMLQYFRLRIFVRNAPCEKNCIHSSLWFYFLEDRQSWLTQTKERFWIFYNKFQKLENDEIKSDNIKRV